MNDILIAAQPMVANTELSIQMPGGSITSRTWSVPQHARKLGVKPIPTSIDGASQRSMVSRLLSVMTY